MEKEISSAIVDRFIRLEGYDFYDDKGNVIDKKEITMKKKKPKYPKTYEECCEVLGINELPYMAYTWNRNEDVEVILQEHQISTILNLDRFRKLLVRRDAYWKLERDWKPDWLYDDTKYILHINSLDICKDMSKHSNYILAFPTEEMRDAFYENFKELIEACNELL